MIATPPFDSKSEEIQKIGKYKVIGAIGRGSMGVVYKAQDPEIGRIVAVKVLRNKPFQGSESQVALERFKTEARSAGNLRHPHIITVFDVNIEGGNPYIVMDFLEGQTLAQILATDGKLPVRKALHYLWQIASGLDHAHSKKVIHRDIKPSNILIDKSDNAFILDFGVASYGEGTVNDQAFLGTPNYMSPEQLQRKQIDYRADLFSFAVMAFELFTGRKPFFGENLASLVNQIINGAAIAIADVAHELPLTLQAEFDKALAKTPEARFQSADAMVAAFSQALGQSLPESGVYIQGGAGSTRKRKFSEWRVVDSVQRLARSLDGHRDRKGTPQESSPWRPELRNFKADAFTLTKGAVHSNRPGTLYSESDNILGAGEIVRPRYRKPTLLLLLICLGFSIFIFYMISTQPDEGSQRDLYTDAGLDYLAPNAPPEDEKPAVDPAKSVFDLTDQELAALLSSERSSESMVVQGIREARQRSFLHFTGLADQLLKRDSYVIRIETLKLLAEIGDSRAVPAVVTTLDDHDPLVRRWAARTLAKIGDRKVVGYLEARLIKDDVEDVKADIKKAIEKITGLPYGR